MQQLNIGEEWGYIDRNGEIVIELQYNYASDFSGGMAVVTNDGMCRLVNDSGDLVWENQFNYWLRAAMNEGLLPVQPVELWGFVDKSGEIVIEAQFDWVLGFSEGLAPAETKDGIGFIDSSGEWVISPQFEDARMFSEGLASVKDHGLWGYIDSGGNLVIEPQFDAFIAHGFENGLAIIEFPQSWGYIDKSGEYVWGPADGKPQLY